MVFDQSRIPAHQSSHPEESGRRSGRRIPEQRSNRCEPCLKEQDKGLRIGAQPRASAWPSGMPVQLYGRHAEWANGESAMEFIHICDRPRINHNIVVSMKASRAAGDAGPPTG